MHPDVLTLLRFAISAQLFTALLRAQHTHKHRHTHTHFRPLSCTAFFSSISTSVWLVLSLSPLCLFHLMSTYQSIKSSKWEISFGGHPLDYTSYMHRKQQLIQSYRDLLRTLTSHVTAVMCILKVIIFDTIYTTVLFMQHPKKQNSLESRAKKLEQHTQPTPTGRKSCKTSKWMLENKLQCSLSSGKSTSSRLPSF